MAHAEGATQQDQVYDFRLRVLPRSTQNAETSMRLTHLGAQRRHVLGVLEALAKENNGGPFCLRAGGSLDSSSTGPWTSSDLVLSRPAGDDVRSMDGKR